MNSIFNIGAGPRVEGVGLAIGYPSTLRAAAQYPASHYASATTTWPCPMSVERMGNPSNQPSRGMECHHQGIRSNILILILILVLHPCAAPDSCHLLVARHPSRNPIAYSFPICCTGCPDLLGTPPPHNPRRLTTSTNLKQLPRIKS